MHIHSNTPSHEVIEHLREVAIRNGANAATIDAIDNLQNVEDVQADLDKANAELTDCEGDRDDLIEAIETLLKALDEAGACEWEKKSPLWYAIEGAENAVSRAEQYKTKSK